MPRPFGCGISCVINSSMRLLLYNPETDFALAAGHAEYTPPASVVDIRRAGALTPVLYASPGDAILLIDSFRSGEVESMELYKTAIQKDIRIITQGMDAEWHTYQADPWGWNHTIARMLASRCPGLTGIPPTEEIDLIRTLSHRRTTIAFLRAIHVEHREGIEIPLEFDNAETAIEYCRNNADIFLKAPWSSSGRGVLRTGTTDPSKAERWIRGTIRRQNSIMAEHRYNRTLDFATEWSMSDGKATFMGISVFETSPAGKYKRNIIAPQEELYQIISVASSGFTESLIDAQRNAIEKVLSGYNGPLGIDMLATAEGFVNPCVEINLRHTMGSAYIF